MGDVTRRPLASPHSFATHHIVDVDEIVVWTNGKVLASARRKSRENTFVKKQIFSAVKLAIANSEWSKAMNTGTVY